MKKMFRIVLCGLLVLGAVPVMAQSRPAVGDTSRVLQRERVRLSRQAESLKGQTARLQDSLRNASQKDGLQARLDRVRVQLDSTVRLQRALEERLKSKRDL